jgi:hypothetical protein
MLQMKHGERYVLPQEFTQTRMGKGGASEGDTCWPTEEGSVSASSSRRCHRLGRERRTTVDLVGYGAAADAGSSRAVRGWDGLRRRCWEVGCGCSADRCLWNPRNRNLCGLASSAPIGERGDKFFGLSSPYAVPRAETSIGWCLSAKTGDQAYSL